MANDPFTAFTEGFMNSQKMGLLKQQAVQQQQEYAQKQKAAEAEAKKAKLESIVKAIDIETPKLDLSPEIAGPAFNNLKKLNKVYYQEMGLEVPEDYDSLTYDAATDKPFVKELQKLSQAVKSGAISPEEFSLGAVGIGSRLYGTRNKDDAAKLAETMSNQFKESGEQESFARGTTLTRQIASTPELAQSPEIMNQVMSERERLLSGAGSKGQDLLAKGMEGEKPEKEVNLEPTIDAFLTRKFGSKYVQGKPEDKRAIIDYLQTPQGQKELDDFAANWAKTKAVPFYPVVPTGDGFVRFNSRNPNEAPVTTGFNKPLTGEMITTQQQIGTVDDTFKRVKELYRPEFVGPIQGRAGAVRSATVGNPEDRATFYSALQDINNTLVYLKSGKQINEQEYARLKGAMPHRNLADSDFRARMIEFEKVFNSIITERQKNMGGYGKGSKPNLKQKYGLE